MRVLTPKQIIENDRARIEAATCTDSLIVAWYQALGSLHTLYELGLIPKTMWRRLHREFVALGDIRHSELEAQIKKGGVQ